MFGEIDCREGLLLAVDKLKYPDLDAAMHVLADIYLQVHAPPCAVPSCYMNQDQALLGVKGACGCATTPCGCATTPLLAGMEDHSSVARPSTRGPASEMGHEDLAVG